MKLNKPIEEYTSLEIAVYACNCDNGDERIDEVAKMIEAYTTAAVKPYKDKVKHLELANIAFDIVVFDTGYSAQEKIKELKKLLA